MIRDGGSNNFLGFASYSGDYTLSILISTLNTFPRLSAETLLYVYLDRMLYSVSNTLLVLLWNLWSQLSRQNMQSTT